MMRKHFFVPILLGVALPAAASEQVSNEPPPQKTYLQLWVGALDTDESSWRVADQQSGDIVHGDIGTLWFGGVADQQLWGDGAWQYGYEGGVLATRKEDSTGFRDANETLRATIDTTFYSVGVFLGGVASVSPIRNLRLYLAAGPSATWAYVDEDDDRATPPPGTSLNVDLSEGFNDVSFEAYARAGIEVVLNNGFAFGVSVRYADDEFDFGESGELEFDETLWLLTLGGRL